MTKSLLLLSIAIASFVATGLAIGIVLKPDQNDTSRAAELNERFDAIAKSQIGT